MDSAWLFLSNDIVIDTEKKWVTYAVGDIYDQSIRAKNALPLMLS